MRALPRLLINTADIELWPADLLRARDSHDQRALALARWVLRRKSDGRYLAAALDQGLVELLPRWQAGLAADAALRALASAPVLRGERLPRAHALPVHGLEARLAGLGLDADAYAGRTGLALVAEPAWLAFAGHDRHARPLWLERDAALAWQRMQAAARDDDIWLESVSGYRSHAYQLGIFARKRARGLHVQDILAVNAAPGFSEHHSGQALDISAPGEPSAEESFEHTTAFAWLQEHAATHGFAMSYPRDNPHGIVYEPWHWRYRAAA
ncbi:M15 family metallopeptidase [Luteimonas sp. MHLX1A]|uniref:M15 family metallopeptidase n=1 Tax=Alterluteimonas muca TaxID=2878684 RepID=UPI001E3B8CD6|nr:D-alanyl-D-alanine carboxypeptidase family protein [Luteimonas sp. MHLX1A]